MLTMRLKDLLEEFEEWVAEGRVKKIPYQEWRFLKQHAEDQVRVERDGWGDLGVFSETCCKFLVEGWAYDDDSFGTYLDTIYIDTFATQPYSYHSASASSGGNYGIANKKQDKPIPTIEINEYGMSMNGKNINDVIKETINEANGFSINGKENDSMNLFKNFDFGSCENDNVKMSMYGIAVKNANGTWVSYDAKSENVVDVDILNFDAKYLYKMPVAIKDVKAGDTIIHCRKPVFVTKNENGKILCVDPAAAEEKIVLPVKNMFGFDFVVKIVNLFEGMNGFEAPSADQPFGNNLWMFMMLEDKGNMSDLLPLMLLSNNGNGFNPLMLLALSNDKTSSNDLLPLLLLSQANTFGQTK